MPLTTRHLEFLLEADVALRAKHKDLGLAVYPIPLWAKTKKSKHSLNFFHLRRLSLLFAFTFTRCNQTAPLLRQMLMELHTPLQ